MKRSRIPAFVCMVSAPMGARLRPAVDGSPGPAESPRAVFPPRPCGRGDQARREPAPARTKVRDALAAGALRVLQHARTLRSAGSQEVQYARRPEARSVQPPGGHA